MNGEALGNDNQSLSISKLLLANPPVETTCVEDFARSAAYSALQSPVKALAQPFDGMTEIDLVSAVSFMEPSKEAQFNTKSYWSQQGGHALGTILTFWAASRVTKCLFRGGLTEQQLATRLSERGVLGLTLKEAAVTGFLHDSLLRPKDEHDTRTLLEARIGNGVNGAATMSVLTASAFGLKKVGVGGDGLRGALSGGPAGIVSANIDSLLRKGELASVSDTSKALVTMGTVGGVFGLAHQTMGRYESGRKNFSWETNNDAAAQQCRVREFKVSGGERAVNEAIVGLAKGEPVLLKVQERLSGGNSLRGFLGLSRFAPESTLLVQHGAKLAAATTVKADMIASCHLDSSLSAKAAVDTTGAMYLRAGRNRISVAAEPQRTNPGESAPLELSKPVGKALIEINERLSSDSDFKVRHEGLQYHDLADYAKILRGTEYPVRRLLGAGFESIAFEAPSGSVLKLTRTAELPSGEWNYDWGTRPYDAKIKGEVTVFDAQSGELALYRQPRVEVGGIDTASLEWRAFLKKVRRNGDEFWDADFAGDQVGQLLDSKTGSFVTRPMKGRDGRFIRDRDGQIVSFPVVVLIDYPSVCPKGER